MPSYDKVAHIKFALPLQPFAIAGSPTADSFFVLCVLFLRTALAFAFHSYIFPLPRGIPDYLHFPPKCRLRSGVSTYPAIIGRILCPLVPLWQMGFDLRNACYNGIHANLFVSIIDEEEDSDSPPPVAAPRRRFDDEEEDDVRHSTKPKRKRSSRDLRI